MQTRSALPLQPQRRIIVAYFKGRWVHARTAFRPRRNSVTSFSFLQSEVDLGLNFFFQIYLSTSISLDLLHVTLKLLSFSSPTLHSYVDLPMNTRSFNHLTLVQFSSTIKTKYSQTRPIYFYFRSFL